MMKTTTNRRQLVSYGVAVLLPLLLVGRTSWAGDAMSFAHAWDHGGGPWRSCLVGNTLSQRLEFASAEQAREILGRPDAFVWQTSDFDRGARQRTLAPTSTSQHLAFTSNAALEWTSAEIAAWAALVDRLSAAAKGLNVTLPRIFFVKTTGAEEFDAAYTRGRSIFLPQRLAAQAASDPRRAFFLLAHELFHVLSRVNPAHRDALYSLLDFERVAWFDYPPELEERRLSNPDAFEYEHALKVQTESGRADVVPVNQSAVPLAEAIALPSIFAALNIVLVSVDVDTGDLLRNDDGTLVTYNFGNTDWPMQMSRNSAFIIHPDEVLADNFATIMETRASGVLDPTNPAGVAINDLGLLLAIEDRLTDGCGRKRSRHR
jgi:hypothetical protein